MCSFETHRRDRLDADLCWRLNAVPCPLFRCTTTRSMATALQPAAASQRLIPTPTGPVNATTNAGTTETRTPTAMINTRAMPATTAYMRHLSTSIWTIYHVLRPSHISQNAVASHSHHTDGVLLLKRCARGLRMPIGACCDQHTVPGQRAERCRRRHMPTGVPAVRQRRWIDGCARRRVQPPRKLPSRTL